MNPNLVINNLNNLNEFIDKIKEISDNIKITEKYNDPYKKSVDDLFTNQINEFYVKKRNLLNNYLINVINLFEDLDSTLLRNQPENFINITPSNYPYTILNNKLNNIGGTSKGYFVFKGGNVIKIWTLQKYIKKSYNIIPNNLQDLLNHKIGNDYDSNILNAYSDYDFTYYLNNIDFTDAIYKDLIEHVIRRMDILRNQLMLDINEPDIIRFIKKYEVHCGIQNYFEKTNNLRLIQPNTDNISFNQNIILNNNIKSSIITKNQNPPNNFNLFVLNENQPRQYINISFNNTILTSTNVDFDLFRLKLNFTSDNNYKIDKFKSELFDLTILRPNDISRIDFCNHINEYTNIITYGNINLRIYSILYTLKDILSILFITNQPNNTIFLWADKKYDKRIVRLGYLFANYLDELKNTMIVNDNFGNRILNTNLTCINVINHINLNNNNDSVYEFILNFLIGYYINLIKQDFVINKNLYESDNRNNEFNNLLRRSLINIKLIMLLMGCSVNIRTRVIHHITNIIHIYTINNSNLINLNNYKRQLNTYNFFDFMLSTYLLYIKSIYLDINIDWCSVNYYNNPVITEKIDIWNFKTNALIFMKLFSKYYILGLQTQTNILQFLIGHLNIPNLIGGDIQPFSFQPSERSYYKPTNIISDELILLCKDNQLLNNLFSTIFFKNSTSLEDLINVCKKNTNLLLFNLLEFINYDESFYEYISENKYTEYINKQNRETLTLDKYVVEIIPKTFNSLYYDNNIILENYILIQLLYLEIIFNRNESEIELIKNRINELKIVINYEKNLIKEKDTKMYNKYLKYKNKYLLSLKNL
jgi:hypothetical protein